AAGLSRRYRLVRRLGAGAMGTVFLAEQIAVGNRPVALKVLNRKLLDDPDFLLRFQNEAASTGRIRHANVVTIYESGQADDGTPYIAMEFLDGESLRQALTRRGQLPVPEVAEILQQAARGLNAAHKLGIIHRDLKPDNIFLTYSEEESSASSSADLFSRSAALGYDRPEKPQTLANRSALPRSSANVLVKIVDFGIAKLRESATHTQTGMVLGTPAYMSFEQASGMRRDELDARSDIYSLGVVVYEMLTGRAPFHSDTPVGYLRMHMQEDPPPFRTVKPDLPALPQLESVVMKALTKDRDQRYSSVLEFAAELTSAAKPSPTAQAPVVIPPTRIVPPALSEPPHLPAVTEGSSWVKFAVLGLVLLAVIAAGIWYFSRSAEQPAAHVTRPASGATVRAAQKPRVDVPLAELVPTPGAARVNPKDGLKYVWIRPGTFMMGCSPGDNECGADEKPPHQVTITKGFWLGQTEVTVGAYKRFAAATGREMPNAPYFNSGWANDTMPIVMVNWNDAHDYCAWARGRLPTEAEWEYAARGGSTGARYGPIDEVAWYYNNSGQKTREVGQKRANAFGLYDMLGNVDEWVNDWLDINYYQNSPSQDPSGPTSGGLRVLRGGSWVVFPRSVRVSDRLLGNPVSRFDHFGFRCGGDVAGQKVAASQSPTAASRQPPKPGSQPPDTKARLAERHLLKGDALFSKADFDGAIAEYREAMRLKPDVADAHGLRGLELEREGDFDGAIAEYREMVRLRPNDARAHFGLGVNLGLKGDWDGEITEERAAIRLKPDNADAHFNLGLALGEKRDLDGAISEFRMAIRVKADYAMAHNALGLALEQKGELHPALEEYRRAYELAPEDPTIRRDYEKLLKRLNPQP
ncbi:MAG: SUMF1/EgtB/PvdO family nonheme iron enzyme, partial [Terriglobia bacterium]